MKKIITLIALIFMSYNIWAQEDKEIGWLTTEEKPSTFGYNKTGTFTSQFMMEFTVTDMMNYESSGEKVSTIKQVQYYLDQSRYSKITDFKVVLLEGDNINEAVPVLTQSVDKENLSAGWVSVDLDDEYAVNYAKSLFIGCQMTYTDGGIFPLNVVAGTNSKQGWFKQVDTIFTRFKNTTTYGGVFLMKAMASMEDANEVEIYLESISVEKKKIVGDSIAISGTIKNLGKENITSFIFHYEVDGEVMKIDTITGISRGPGRTYPFTSSLPFIVEEAKRYNIKIVVSEPNEVQDYEANNYIETIVQGYSEDVPMIVLHEAFSSSTCVPCSTGNIALKRILNAADTSAWVCLKYQSDSPSTGDPYYTNEVRVRSEYYDISGVPTLFASGYGGYNGHPANYSTSTLNKLTQQLSLGTITGNAEIEGKTVNFNASITPVTSIKDTAFRFFAAIVEKRTVKNVRTNGEREFHYVMKKFMTKADGDPMDSIKAGETKNFNYSYTFNGDYRLPSNALSPINHEIENSVENFDYLMVVCWFQDIRTGEVFQAGKADPNPHLTKIDKIDENEVGMSVYPNPTRGDMVYVDFELKNPIKGQISVHDMVGKELVRLPEGTYSSNQTVSLDISNLSSGVYFIRLNTSEGATAKKLIITK